MNIKRLKMMLNVATVWLLLLFCAFGQSANVDKVISVNNKSSQLGSLGMESPATASKKEIAGEDDIDSLRLDTVLKNALKLANENIQSDDFFKEYIMQPDDSSYVVNVNLTMGYLFSNEQKHLLIRREIPWAIFINVYHIVDAKLEEVIYREQGEMTYIRDTIADVNGDGYKDFLVHWYPSSGCCRRDVYNVYLNLSDKGTFTEDYEFINPTFSPKEQIIRGVGYGHPGEVGLYKYKWNGLQIDTIEFIYPDVSRKGQFIKTKKKEHRPAEKDGEILDSVPTEYRNIESYEWFIDF